MADQQVPQQYPRPEGQQDTDVLSWPAAGGQSIQGPADPPAGPYYPRSYAPAGSAFDGPSANQSRYAPDGSGSWAGSSPGSADGLAGYPAGWVPGESPANPEAAYWESRFRRQRTWTRFLGATIAAGVLLFVGGSLFVWNVVLPRATDSLSQELGAALPGLGLPDSDSFAPDPTSPDAPLGDGGQGPAPDDLSDVPLPDQLKGIGSRLGIDNMEELLDTAVSMGLMSPEQADQIREAVSAGGSLGGLLGSGGLGG